MKISELVTKLNDIQDAHGDITVMFEADHGGPFEVWCAMFREAHEDEFPEDFNMPAGFKFVKLFN